MFDYIEFIICHGENITPEQVRQKTRKLEIVFARQLIFYFSKLYKLGSLAEIGRLFGEKDHTTVLHSVGVIENYIETDRMKRVKIEKYATLLNSVYMFLVTTDNFKERLMMIEQESSDLVARAEKLRAILNPMEDEARSINVQAFKLTGQITELKGKIPTEG